MMKISAIGCTILLSGCLRAQVGEEVPFFGGSKAGGFDFQTNCSVAGIDGAGCAAATRTAGGRIDLQQVVLKDSTSGTLVKSMVPLAFGKVADYATARSLQRNAPPCSSCGGSTQILVQGGQGGQAVAAANAKSKNDVDVGVKVNSAPAPCTTCGGRKKLPMM